MKMTIPKHVRTQAYAYGIRQAVHEYDTYIFVILHQRFYYFDTKIIQVHAVVTELSMQELVHIL